jgi:hypothetical protein
MSFTNSDLVLDKLTKNLGRICIEVTNYKVVEADEEIIPKVEGPFILVDLNSLEQIDWQTNEIIVDGEYRAIHNYTATYTLTAYRGNPHMALARVLQALNLPYIYDKYFPLPSPFAYSSSSSIARMRVPLNAQFYEKRARVQIIFNIVFVEGDFGTFEDLEKIGIDFTAHSYSGDVEAPINVG